MTIEEAIAILSDIKKSYPPKLYKLEKNALNWGIEALKRENKCRENVPREKWLLLPGETE